MRMRAVLPLSYFYPRPPRGGRPLAAHAVVVRLIFLSTPSARRATLEAEDNLCQLVRISIHALREEGDRCTEHIAQR